MPPEEEVGKEEQQQEEDDEKNGGGRALGSFLLAFQRFGRSVSLAVFLLIQQTLLQNIQLRKELAGGGYEDEERATDAAAGMVAKAAMAVAAAASEATAATRPRVACPQFRLGSRTRCNSRVLPSESLCFFCLSLSDGTQESPRVQTMFVTQTETLSP